MRYAAVPFGSKVATVFRSCPSRVPMRYPCASIPVRMHASVSLSLPSHCTKSGCWPVNSEEPPRRARHSAPSMSNLMMPGRCFTPAEAVKRCRCVAASRSSVSI
eukprot:scaffold12992_cov58-Phaeocystis_antarctica.AAC.14